MANTSNGYRGPEKTRTQPPAQRRQVCPESGTFSLGYSHDTSGRRPDCRLVTPDRLEPALRPESDDD